MNARAGSLRSAIIGRRWTVRGRTAGHRVTASGKIRAELEYDPRVGVAQTAIEEVQKVEGNTREREHEAPLAAQEAEQAAIENQNPGQGGRSEAEQPDAKWRQEDE